MHFQELLQRKRIIVRGIVRTIDQGDRFVACRLDDWPPCIWIVFQFDEITTSELIPLSRIMAKPLPQFGAGDRKSTRLSSDLGACRLDDWPPCIWIVFQFDEITTSELIPLSRIMAKPLPQFGA